jgi:mannan endo-1,4-beta-mannosidase
MLIVIETVHINHHQNTTSGKFAGRQGLNFTIDGQADYFAGTNSYWIGFLTDNSDVDLVLDHLQHSGIRILRVWGFNDVNAKPAPGKVYYQLLQNGNATINTGPDGLQRLDYVVAAAEKRGIKLIINFVNNWSDYGGINAYTTAFGGNSTSWYTSSVIQRTYRQYIKAVVSRYNQSSAIFAWELANEPRCKGCDTSVIYKWASSTSAFIKSIDPNHMIGIGDGK